MEVPDVGLGQCRNDNNRFLGAVGRIAAAPSNATSLTTQNIAHGYSSTVISKISSGIVKLTVSRHTVLQYNEC